jgi:hypothetical protein
MKELLIKFDKEYGLRDYKVFPSDEQGTSEEFMTQWVYLFSGDSVNLEVSDL